MDSRQEKRTRAIFHEIHKEQAGTPSQLDRLMVQTDFTRYGLSEDFFRGKICLEAGCGSLAPASQNLLRLGAERVYCFDLDETILELAPGNLAPYEGRFEITVGDVMDLSYENDFFDFVVCDAVLHHTGDVERGVRELARVTKPGGTLFVTLFGKGGLVWDLTDVFRKWYGDEPEFRQMIDDLDGDQLMSGFRWLKRTMEENDDSSGAVVSEALFAELFDQDLTLTIKDRIQVPCYDRTPFEDLKRLLAELGFGNIRRVRGDYQRFPNIRRYLAPLYADVDNPVARVLYGEGYLKIFADKI